MDDIEQVALLERECDALRSRVAELTRNVVHGIYEQQRLSARVAELEDISNIRIKAFEDARNAIEETGIGITSPIAWRKADDALCALIMREGK